MTKQELINIIEKEGYLIRNIGKSVVVVDDPNNEREISAKKFSDKYKARFQIGNKVSQSTPTVFINGYEIRFKNLKSKFGNKGNEYERYIYSQLVNKADISSKEINEFLRIKDIELSDIINVEFVGNRNTKRSIDWNAGKLVLDGWKNLSEIGEKIADIVVYYKKDGDIEKAYISNKTGNTTTFVNAGIGKPTKDNPNLKKLCDYLGINYSDVIRGFENYITDTGPIEVPRPFNPKISKNDLKLFLDSAIGENYIYMSPQKTFEMTSEKREQITSNPRDFMLALPSKGRKRVDFIFKTDGFEFIKIVIRNKQGGIWPTHIMCDYKLK